jgi:hypothetical protein
MLATMIPKRSPGTERSMAEYNCSGMMTLKITISIAPRMEPAVLPTGRKGTAGKTAKIQKIAKATEPKTTFSIGARAISITYKIKLVCELPLSSPPPLQKLEKKYWL